MLHLLLLSVVIHGVFVLNSAQGLIKKNFRSVCELSSALTDGSSRGVGYLARELP
jgi:hypothetical protein